MFTCHRLPRRSAAALVLVVAASWPLAGQPGTTAASSAGPFDRLLFRNIGPATMSGRIDDLAVLERDPSVFYVAAATGGLWKTVNNGTTWEVLFDDQDDVVSIGDVAIAPDDANTVWVGTGEANNRQSSSWGRGVYKSTDGGRTWAHMGLGDSKHIARIVVDPVDHDVVYVAALGSLWGPGGERGVYKTTDGGLTWTRVHFVDEDTGATELVQDPTNNKVLYAATYQRRRAVWGFNGGGSGSGIWKSADAGRTWQRVSEGIPEGPLGRIGLDIYRKDPRVVYALVQHAKESGVYRSDDAGRSWRKLSDQNPRPMYFSQIRVDPNTDSRVYVLGVQLHVSDDGGRTFRANSSMHADHHAFWINPANSRHVITGCDGGVGISWDGARTFDYIDNMDLGQFYHVGFDMETPYHLYGGLQDNNSWGGPSRVRSRLGIGNGDWFVIGGGDGFVAIADPQNSRVLYTELQDGRMSRVDRDTNERTTIRPEPARGEPPLRWNWNTPLLISPHDSNTIYAAANRVFKSTDRAQSWTAISPDLTAGVDRETLPLMGIVAKDFALAKHDGVAAYGTIVAFAESPRQAGLFFAGADDGTVQVSRDAGATWDNVSARFPGLPKGTYVSRLVPSAHEANVAYATFDGHRADDFGTYVYASRDQGRSWTAMTTGIPKGYTVHVVTEDPKNPDVLYLGTEFGLFVSLDRGARWTRWKANLPTVPIHGIVVHPRENDLILATHGRSIWILDDLTPVQRAGAVPVGTSRLFDVRPATFFNEANDRTEVGDRRFWGQNPPVGALVGFALGKAANEVALRVTDADGAVVRELKDDATKEARSTGIHRLVWDLRHAPSAQPAFLQHEQAAPGPFGRMLDGPPALPGTYRATLVVDGAEVANTPVVVRGDPLIAMSDADRRAHFETAMALHGLQASATRAADAVLALGRQVEDVRRLAATARAPEELKGPMDEASRKLENLRQRLGMPAPGQPPAPAFGGPPNVRTTINQVKTQVTGSTSRPTETQLRQLREAREDLAAVVADVNALIGEVMPKLLSTAGGALRPAVTEPLPPMNRQP